MKAFQTSILFSAFALALIGCQSKSFQINGTVEGIENGDTLYLTSDMETGVPQDTLIVEDGKFSLSGETDSVYLCMIYSATRNEVNIPFFMEPGNIRITLIDKPGASRVSGTNANEEWQRLNDSVMVIGKEINKIAEHIYGNNVSMEEQKLGLQRIDKLNEHFSHVILEATERNIDNEFGYFLLTYYPEELISNANRERLINKLPDEMRSRPVIKQMEESIRAAAKTAEGAVISNFKQSTPDGEELSIMDEVRQHKVTVIDFWASWCGPCQQEMPNMIEMYNKYKDSGLGIVGVSLDSDRDSWLQATSKLGITWPQMSDLNGWENAAAQMFNVTAIPHTIVVDQDGKILRRGLRGQELDAFIAEQLK